MKVLMFGWEFPPFSSGGLGTACQGLSKSLVKKQVDLTFIIPYLPQEAKTSGMKLLGAANQKIKIKGIPSIISPYMTSDEYHERLMSTKPPKSMYGKDLYQEVYLYSERARKIAEQETFDIIHSHDWMTYPAGIKAKKVSGRPFVIHVHATEFDRTGGNPNQYVYNIEKEGMHAADHICAVSNFTKNKIVEHYGINPDKVTVVHNAVEFTDFNQDTKLNDGTKTVLFLGRITLQKGPDYFIYAAKRVLDVYPNARFVIAGSGDMERFVIEKAAELGIANKVLFAGFLQGDDIDRAYRMADVYVMPSVSEPFGITPLEALRNNTPVIISKQSGVSEVLTHALKVDFWDVDELANKIVGVLKYNVLENTLIENGVNEVKKFNWDIPAQKCIDVYNNLLNRGGPW